MITPDEAIKRITEETMKNQLVVTIVEKDKKSRETTYEVSGGEVLSIPELGYSYYFGERAKQMLRASGVIYYMDSVSPIDKPDKQIIKRYIEVRMK